MDIVKQHLIKFKVPTQINHDILCDIYEITQLFGTTIFHNPQLTKGVKGLCVTAGDVMITSLMAKSRAGVSSQPTNYSLALILDQFDRDGFSDSWTDEKSITHKLHIDKGISTKLLEEYIIACDGLAESQNAIVNGESIEKDLLTYKIDLVVNEFFTVAGSCIPVVRQNDETDDQLYHRAQLTIGGFDHPEKLMTFEFGEHSPIGNGIGIIRKADYDFVSLRQKAAIEAMQELGIKFGKLGITQPDMLAKLKSLVEKKINNGEVEL